LSYKDQAHVESYWRNRSDDANHAHNCSRCSRICENVIDKMEASSGKGSYTTKHHKGTKINFSLLFLEALDEDVNDFFESSDAFSGYNISLEQNVGWLQFEGGYKTFNTTNDLYRLDEYKIKTINLNASITAPMIPYFSPYIGGGYSYTKISILQNGINNNFDNSSLFYFGGIDVRITPRFYLTGKYIKTFKAEEYDINMIECGLKYVWK